jgi:uncharacterized OsmC-like protein
VQPSVVQPQGVRSYQTRTFGRCITAVGSHHFVVDHSVRQEGPGEQPGPVEYFLFGISSCGVLMTEREARNRGISLQSLEVRIEAVRRDAADPPGGPMTFQSASVEFDFVGPTEAQATELVEHYKHT